MTPLRQMTPAVVSANAHLFAPRTTYRLPRDTNDDTPLPPEEPAGRNPPDGAILYYYLKSAAAAPVTLEVFDSNDRLVRRFASTDKGEPASPLLDVPTHWLRPFQALSGEAGMHRFVWDLHAAPVPGRGGRRGVEELPISAIYQDTPSAQGEWMPPGTYEVKLTVGGQTYSQALVVKPDPRER
jgi:hypothetical protein